MEMVKNYYGSLCTEMYEILHKDAPQDELLFYLSYAEKEFELNTESFMSGRMELIVDVSLNGRHSSGPVKMVLLGQ